MAKLVKKLRFTAELSTFGDGMWVYVPVTREMAAGIDFPDKRFKRVICSINKQEGFHCALMPSGSGSFIISVNKQKREMWGLKIGDHIDVRLEIDTSKYGLPMPEEFRAVLDQDPEGDRLFHALTPGKQRSLLYQAGQKADVDLRIHRALAIVNHLTENDGKVIFDKLAHELKRPKLKDLHEYNDEW
ncbi:MAG TPA: DUF1905 domain-containing protein [Pyrinomonadaceae bacterium]|nr:DUF1905 domain-containing protein [Pyrinomonadaceae bacterium]